MKSQRIEITVGVPTGYALVGVRTDDEDVIIVVEPRPSEIRRIGFAPTSDDEDEEDIDNNGRKEVQETG